MTEQQELLRLDDCIKTTIKDGYIHHIPRLMVISNIMNLSGVDPKEIYKVVYGNVY